MAKGTVYIDADRCKGCGLCVAACPYNLLALDMDTINKKGYQPAILIDPENKCIACMNCAMMCPDVVIKVEKF